MNESTSKNPVASPTDENRILRHLLSVYGETLGIGGKTNTSIAAQIHDRMAPKVSPGTIRQILDNELHDRHPDTYKNLCHFFQLADSRISSNAFFEPLSKLEETTRTWTKPTRPIEIFAKGSGPSFAVPKYIAAIESLRARVVGTYVTYRYAFELRERFLIAREVLHIDPDSPELPFQSSYSSRIEEVDPNPGIFKGKAVPIGKSLCLMGFHENPDNPDKDRGRALFFTYDSDQVLNKANIGIVAGTRMYPDYSACAAKILIVRVNDGVKNLDEFIRKVTRNLPAKDVLRQDFGRNAEDHKWIENILENRAFRKLKRHDEPTVRAKLEEFKRGILRILEDARSAKSPFTMSDVYTNPEPLIKSAKRR